VTKKNPKHEKKIEKKIYYVRKKQYDSRKIPVKYIAMGVIFVLSITSVVLLAIFLPDSPLGHGDNLFIEDGDIADIHYKLWTDDDRDGFIDIDEDPIDDYLLDYTITKGSLINGFYYEILDLEMGETSRFRIEPNVDVDGDGYDDNNPDEEVLGYGNPGHDLFNMSLYYWIRVDNITKSEENTPASSNFAVQVDNIPENSLYCSVRKLFSFEFLENY